MRAISYDGHTSKPLDLADAKVPSSSYRWVDVRSDGPKDPELVPMLTALGYSDVMIQYAERTDSMGMFSAFDGRIVGATWAVDAGSSDLQLVHFAWDKAGIVTVRFGADRAMDGVRRIVEERGMTLFGRPTVVPGVLLQLVLATVDRHLTSVGEAIDDVDSAIIEKVEPNQLGQLRALRTTVAPMVRRFPVYADNLSEALVDPTSLPGMDAQGAQYLQAYSDHFKDLVGRVGDAEDSLRNAAQDFQTEMGNQQGNRINQLTVVSILFLPVTFLTGYFGMNFQWLDNELMSLGSWLVLGVLLPILMVIGSGLVLVRRGYSLRLWWRRSKVGKAQSAHAARRNPQQ
ncbi:MAG: CorA family divalent cation transporter [Candidatus Nanopelagicales bacterium]